MYLSLLLLLLFYVYCAQIAGGQYPCDSPARVYRQPIGGAIHLVCGCPQGTSAVDWYKNGSEVALLQQGLVPFVYTVHVLSAGDGGEYECVCDSSVAYCFVLKVDIAITQCEIVPTYVPVGGEMTVYCGAVGYPPPARCDVSGPIPNMVSVTLNGSLVQWVVSNVTLENSGRYSCIVYDGTTVDEKKAYVTIYEQPEVIEFNYTFKEGMAFLHCRVSNHSTPHVVTFLQDGRLINTSLQKGKYSVQILEQTNISASYVLIVVDFSQADMGVYTCQVGSPYRAVEHQRALRINRLPSVPTHVVPSTNSTTASGPGNGSKTVLYITLSVVVAIVLIAAVVVVMVFCVRKSCHHGSKHSHDLEMQNRLSTNPNPNPTSDPVKLSTFSDPIQPSSAYEENLSPPPPSPPTNAQSSNDVSNSQTLTNVPSSSPPTLSILPVPQTPPPSIPPAPPAPLPPPQAPSRAQSG